MRGMFLATWTTPPRVRRGERFVMGANIAGFLKVADAMLAQGVC